MIFYYSPNLPRTELMFVCFIIVVCCCVVVVLLLLFLGGGWGFYTVLQLP